jgi:lipid-binding SYLF domain-containing protein
MLLSLRMKPQNGRDLAVGVGVIAAVLSVGCSSSTQKGSASATQKELTDVANRLDDATALVGSSRAQIPDDVANRATCVLVLPGIKQGGLVVGGKGGKGFATCASGGTWSPPAPITIGGGTLGAQVGFQSMDVLALITSNRAMKSLESGNFKVGVDASASAGPVGAGRGASGDMTVKSDVVSYTRASGLFAGATLDGTTINEDTDGTRALYGPDATLESILEHREPMPQNPAVARFEAAMNSSFRPNAVSLLRAR